MFFLISFWNCDAVLFVFLKMIFNVYFFDKRHLIVLSVIFTAQIKILTGAKNIS